MVKNLLNTPLDVTIIDGQLGFLLIKKSFYIQNFTLNSPTETKDTLIPFFIIILTLTYFALNHWINYSDHVPLTTGATSRDGDELSHPKFNPVAFYHFIFLHKLS